jgi:hypothetical protein
MSDREIIIRLLRIVEWRLRANRLIHELTVGLTLFLIFPVALKLWDLAFPLKGLTITVAFVFWILALSGYVVWRFMKKETLDEAASSIDQQAGLNDEIKTAFWFIRNPRSSDWVDAQIQRASKNAERVDLNSLYPRRVPRAGYIAAVMIFVFLALNFVPLPLNHNWLALQAAPAFSLTPDQEAALRQIQEFLRQNEALRQSELGQRLEEALRKIEEGELDPSQAPELLDEIQKLLAEGDLDLQSVNQGLEEVAKDLQQSDKLQDASKAMLDKNLNKAADEMRKVDLSKATPESLKELEESLKQAAENSGAGLEQLLKDLAAAEKALQQQNRQLGQASLKQAAGDLDSLQSRINFQQLKNQLSQRLKDLQNQLRQQNGKEQQTKTDQNGEGIPSDQTVQQQGTGDQPGEADDTVANGAAEQLGGGDAGNGDQPGAPTGGEFPQRETTQLDVQLEKEKLAGLQDSEVKPEDIEEVSKQERSRLDYRQVRTELSPAEKDLLNQDNIPWEYRPLIKSYFQAIRPPGKK